MKVPFTQHLAALVVIAAGLLPGPARSAPMITFHGEVTDQTCQATVNGETSGFVLLPTVSSSALTAAGATAGLTPFTLQVRDCQAPAAALDIGATFLGHNVTAGGNLGNAGTAGNVAIQLTTSGSGGTPVVLGGPTRVPGLVLDAGQTSASYQFGAQYISEAGGAVAGTVQAVAEYALTYL